MSETDTRPSPRAQRQPRRPSGRFFVRASVCVALGVLLSFASALPVLWVREVLVRSGYSSSEARSDSIVLGDRLGVRVFALLPFKGTGRQMNTPVPPWWSVTHSTTIENTSIAWEIGTGWPMPVMSGGFIADTASRSDRILRTWGVTQVDKNDHLFLTFVPPAQMSDGLKVSRYGRSPILPTRIIWRGLIGNTIFYALIVWGVFALLGWWRRARRRRRNKCEGCAYSLKGLEDAPRCPECGREIRRNHVNNGLATSP